jgi:mannose/fructose/N-acetylgalactosamine-specific phosphotransferase system component IIC
MKQRGAVAQFSVLQCRDVSIPFYLQEITLLSLLAGVLAVDDRAGWQGLWAHPVVVAVIVGLIFNDFTTAVSVGVVLELVWLSVLPMRGVRRPDAVAGSVVGIGTAVLLVRHTGDLRIEFIVALAAVLGLIAGELAGSIGRRFHRVRERRLGRFAPPAESRPLQHRLLLHLCYSVGFIFGVELLLVAVMLPVSAVVAERLTAVAGPSVADGSRWWVHIIPVLGAGALIQMYWLKQQSRYLVLSAAVILLLLWIT